MNRYRASGPSQATANTLCQKCLKKGHYSYECTASLQDRRYVSRPSRTQQLLNPKLAPKITEVARKAEETELLTASKLDVSKRKREENEPEVSSPKRSRSVSSYSSDSVSTISTNRSRSASRSPPTGRKVDSLDIERRISGSSNGPTNDRTPIKSESRGGDHAHQGRREDDSRNETRRRHSSGSSKDSPRPSGRSGHQHEARSRSPAAVQARREIRSRSRSPFRRTEPDDSRKIDANKDLNDRSSTRNRRKERSASPYSKRLALTRARQGD